MNNELDLSQEKPKHGGNLLALRRSLGVLQDVKESWIDLSSAVNRHPWPVPEVPVFLWYELPDLDSLKQAAADYYGANNFVPIAGTQQAIEALPNLLFASEIRHKTKVLVPEVGYQEHGFAWSKWQYAVDTYKNTQDLTVKSWQVLVLIQPNNPSANKLTLAELLSLIETAQVRKAYLIIDEAFIDGVVGASLLSHYQDKAWPACLIVLRSVGKFFGLPGARVGFCFASQLILKGLASVTGPWPIATPATWLLSQAFKDVSWQIQASRDLVSRSQRFEKEIKPLINQFFIALSQSVRWQQSELFYTLFCDEAEGLFEWLQALSIHVRLGDAWLRFALPADTEFDLISKRVQQALLNGQTQGVGQVEEVE
ncbi:cobalamin biosynthetic protein [Marinomonas sp. MED121]|uniref:aminotransferase class I/II-fold pyridoxal phosphate-dependent enzyme n=1 Tax=Marinomonas sp. MED121 TaxID=314277 RepID=UPI0000690062|nr:aminotransferase class I/II-fold pyridoxal phosphate-dependent enzyme [Marinomonas sp. MED121]EAQ65659.1 cobalamin biosynthetic protein [Marinomonas sp. MED121]